MKTKIRLFDYHTQTLEHGVGKLLKVEETIQSAINKNLKAICLTDHFPFPPNFPDPTDDLRVKYPAYYQLVMQLKEKYRTKIEVLLGAEFDWLADYKRWTISQLDQYPFDYTIGSVHYLGKIKDQQGERIFCHDFTEEEFKKGLLLIGSPKKFISMYYREIIKMVESRLFDCVGHLDLVKKYNDGSIFSEQENWYRKLVLEVLGVIAESEMVMEINTAGWDKPCKAQYPSLWILKEAKKRKIKITIGSDTHTPEDVGKNLGQAIKIAQEAGYSFIVRFKKRKIIEEVKI